MKAVLQRIKQAEITINGSEVRKVGAGFLILVGVMEGDTENQAEFLAKKIMGLRVFTDENDKMNLSLEEISGEVMIVSNFTLGADCKKGRRPSYVRSARPEIARGLYETFVEYVKKEGIAKKVETGEFGADMQIALINDGPVTLILDTDEIQPQK